MVLHPWPPLWKRGLNAIAVLHKVAYWHQHAERQPAETDHAKGRGTPAGVDSRKGAECGISVSRSLIPL